MRILVDENIPLMTVRALRDLGHDVLDIRATSDKGATDDEVWQIAQQDRRLLVTTDRGFASHRQEEHAGILIVALRQPNRLKIHRRIIGAMEDLSPQRWPGLLIVMRDRTQSRWPPT